jgi:hypothetical protein
VAGLEYLSGRPASRILGSPDLPLAASVAEKISAMSASGLPPAGSLGRHGLVAQLAEQGPIAVDGWDAAEMS